MAEMIKIVRYKGKRVGVLVPDIMGLCNKGCVMVDFDGGVLKACCEDSLELVERVEIKFNPEKCKDCVFSSGSDCHRHHNGALGWLLSGAKKHIPTRIYPHCQDEIADQKVGK